jgi:hypothetical protein
MTDKFEESLEYLISSFVDQGYPPALATKIVNEMFARNEN